MIYSIKKKILFSSVIILIILSVYLSYLLVDEVEKRTIDQQLEQQEIYADQAALSIKYFFDQFQYSLNFLSNKEEIINFTDESKLILKNYYEAHAVEIKAITRISEMGEIIYTYPFVESVIGKDISDQPHNAEIMETNKPVVSDVFMAVQGYRAIVYAYPIFDGDKYTGAISLVIPFDQIANKFIEGIQIGKTGNSFVISEAGIELYCTQGEHLGKPIFELIEDNSELSKLVDDMLANESGRGFYYRKNGTSQDDLSKKLVAYKRVKLENTFWSIAVSISKDEILEANRGFTLKLLLLTFILTLGGFLFLYLYARQRRKNRAAIREKEIQHNNELEDLVEKRTLELKKINQLLTDDIKERKKIEEELKYAIDRVEKSEKIKSEFLAQMSHEIRTPINTILNFTSLIKEGLSEYADEELKYGFVGIDSASKRLIRTIDLILNMSSMQLGIHEYIPKTIDICKDVINQLAVEHQLQISTKNLEFNIEVKSDDVSIIADSYTVNQIFANLIDNSIKYTEKGSIKLVCDRNDKNELFVSVIDTGVGISQEYIPRLFDEFSQEDRGYTRKFEGNGLGLALVKKYCDLNNARIEVESQKDVGSKFTVTFDSVRPDIDGLYKK